MEYMVDFTEEVLEALSGYVARLTVEGSDVVLKVSFSFLVNPDASEAWLYRKLLERSVPLEEEQEVTELEPEEQLEEMEEAKK